MCKQDEPPYDDDPVVNAREAAHLLGIHVNTLVRISAVNLPYFVLNERGDRRYERRDIEAFIAKRRVVTGRAK